jgi:CheY-like chemotaxis protein
MTGKVLIVDYDSRSLETMSELLRAQKLQIIQAADGQAAYDKFKSAKPDLVILEAILPKIHGFDLTKKISQESEGRVPVIIVRGCGAPRLHEALTPSAPPIISKKARDPKSSSARSNSSSTTRRTSKRVLDPIRHERLSKAKAKPTSPRRRRPGEDASAWPPREGA